MSTCCHVRRADLRRSAVSGDYAAGNSGARVIHAVQRPVLIIFDCDGVLVDSERACNQVMADLLAEHGLRLTLEETIERFIGRSVAQCIAIITELLGKAPPGDFQSRLSQRTRAALEAELTAVPGVDEMLSTLAEPYCVASNGNRAKMTFTLGHTGLLERFAGRMFCADDVAAPKPAPDLFLHAARRFDADPSRCIVVEDTPTGVAAARAAGMTALGFAALTPVSRLRDAGAHATFSQMRELQGLLTAGGRDVSSFAEAHVARLGRGPDRGSTGG